MNITAVGMTYNIQPVNRRHNNVRFTGNQQSQRDSFILNPLTKIKRAISKKEKAKLMDRLEDPRLGDSAATTLVEIIANDGMRSLNQVLQSTEGLTSKRADHLRIIANKALDISKPQVTLEIAETLTETLKNSDNTQVYKDRIIALARIGLRASNPNPEITAGIAKALIENFQDPNKSDIRPQITEALSTVTYPLTYKENPKVDEVFEALAEVLKKPDNPYICTINPIVLGETANRALKSGNREVADVAVKTLTETLKNSDNTQVHKDCILALKNIGKKASSQNPGITAGIAKALIGNFQDPNKSDIHPQIIYALNDLTTTLIRNKNPEADEVLETLAEALKNSNNPYIYKIHPIVLGKTAGRALKSGKPEVAYGLVKNLTETFKNSDDTQVHGDCIQALENIGKKALKIKNKPSIVPNTLIANSDEIVRLVISQLFKIGTNPKLYKEEESSTFFRIDGALWNLKEKSAKIRGDIKYIEDCRKAIQDLDPYKKKVSKFDQVFKQDNLDELLKNSKRKELDELYYDLRSTGEAFKKMYDARPKTLPEDVDQRYKKFMEYFENKEIIKNIIILRKFDQFPDDIIREILKKMFSPSIVSAAI